MGFGIYSKGNGPPNQPAGTFPNENTSLLQACSHLQVSTWLRKQGEKGISPDFPSAPFPLTTTLCAPFLQTLLFHAAGEGWLCVYGSSLPQQQHAVILFSLLLN